jgi:hypothetical protein
MIVTSLRSGVQLQPDITGAQRMPIVPKQKPVDSRLWRLGAARPPMNISLRCGIFPNHFVINESAREDR